MVAADGIDQLGYLRIFAFLADKYTVPEHIGFQEVFRFTGENAGIAADTSFKLYSHSPSH
jgi:hypothetical protein